METDEGTVIEPERWAGPRRPAPWRLRAVLAGVTVVVALAVMAYGEAETRPGDGEMLLGVVSGAMALVVLAALAGRARGRAAPAVLLALGGVAVVAVGSGVGRGRGISLVVAPDGLSGSSQRVLQTWWPVVGLGLALVAAGVVAAGVERRPALGIDDRGRVRAVVGACGAFAAGIVAIAVVLREVTGYSFISGRPERRRGRRQPGATGAGGNGAGAAADDPAGWWREAAADEAASVAAFEALATRLEAVGAPVELVRRARDAAADEVRHARACTHLARMASAAPGARVGPVDLAASGPQRGSAGPSGRVACRSAPVGSAPIGRGQLAHPGAGPAAPDRGVRWRVEVVGLAVESWADGVVGERSAAARLRAGAATAADPAARLVLRAMARDEDRHADLGADVVRWCRGQSPRLVGAVVRRAAARLPEGAPLPPSQRSAEPARLRAAGLADAATVQALWDEGRAAARHQAGLVT